MILPSGHVMSGSLVHDDSVTFLDPVDRTGRHWVSPGAGEVYLEGL
jgi:hypothetical protein